MVVGRVYFIRIVFVAMACLMGDASQAEPMVIYDSGQTQALTSYLSVFSSPTIQPQRHTNRQGQLASTPRFDIHQYLPVRTPELSPGKVTRRALEKAPATPLFLIGSDTFSQHWLVTHRVRLREVGAVGLLVQAESVEDLKTIDRLAAGLKLTPASGSDIARHLDLRHYPVLISREGIEQ